MPQRSSHRQRNGETDPAREGHRAITVPNDQVDEHHERNSVFSGILAILSSLGTNTPPHWTIQTAMAKGKEAFKTPEGLRSRAKVRGFFEAMAAAGRAMGCSRFPADMALTSKPVNEQAMMRMVGEFARTGEDGDGIAIRMRRLWRRVPEVEHVRAMTYHMLMTDGDLSIGVSTMLTVLLVEADLWVERFSRYTALPGIERHNPRNAEVIRCCYTLCAYETLARLVLVGLPASVSATHAMLTSPAAQTARDLVTSRLIAYQARLVNQPEVAALQTRRTDAIAALFAAIRPRQGEDREQLVACTREIEYLGLDRFRLTREHIQDAEVRVARAEVAAQVVGEVGGFVWGGGEEEPPAVATAPARPAAAAGGIDAMMQELCDNGSTGGVLHYAMEESDSDGTISYDEEGGASTANARTLRRRQLLKAKRLRERQQAAAAHAAGVAASVRGLLDDVFTAAFADLEVAATLDALLASVTTRVIADAAREREEADAADALLEEVFAELAIDEAVVATARHDAQRILVLHTRPRDIHPEFMLRFVQTFVPSLARIAREEDYGGLDPLIGHCRLCFEPFDLDALRPYYLRCCAQAVCLGCAQRCERARHPHPVQFSRADPLIEQWVVLRKEMGLPVPPRYDE